jgi:hypothetical protein
MLSASLRPGPWPGLRALTTPARGTDWPLRDGGHLMTGHNDVDANITRAYGGLITSVPHGTPPVRHNGIRSAHSADRPKGTVWSASSQHRSLLQDHRSAVDLHTVGCELHGFSRRRVLRTTRRNEAAFTRA